MKRTECLSGEVLRRIRNAARRLDRVYCGGFGNEIDAIQNRLLAAALAAQANYRGEVSNDAR